MCLDPRPCITPPELFAESNHPQTDGNHTARKPARAGGVSFNSLFQADLAHRTNQLQTPFLSHDFQLQAIHGDLLSQSTNQLHIFKFETVL
jgi:hypothetical protein